MEGPPAGLQWHHASCLLPRCPGTVTQPSSGAAPLMARWQRAGTRCRAAPGAAEGSGIERGEGWRIEAEASPPTQGDALEARLTEQVEEGTPGGVPDDLAQHSARPRAPPCELLAMREGGLRAVSRGAHRGLCAMLTRDARCMCHS